MRGKGLYSGKAMRKRLLAGALGGCVMLALTACGSGYKGDTLATPQVAENYYEASSGGAGNGFSMSAVSDAYQAEYEYAAEEGAYQEGVQVKDSSRKLIKTVYMDVETKEFDLMMASLESQVEELGGYIENMETYNGSRYSGYQRSRYSNLVIRIPQGNLDIFLDTMSETGNVISRSESVEDVTLSYVDMESRKNSLQVEQERLLSFLEQAESIEDIITIEDRLSYVRYQIESMESQLRTYDNQVDYSTVHLSVSEVKELTPVVEKSAWQRMADGFMDSVKRLGHNLAEIGIWFVVNLPFLLVWAAVIALGVFGIRRLIRRSRKKKEKKQAEMNQAVPPVRQEDITRK